MAVAVIIQGGPREGYDAVTEKVFGSGPADPPQGAILHAAGETPQGVRIVDIWESREDFERFMSERIAPAMGELGIEMSGPEPEIIELFNVMVAEEARSRA